METYHMALRRLRQAVRGAAWEFGAVSLHNRRVEDAPELVEYPMCGTV